MRRYVHLSTGNYNATTARIYEDLGLFTCQPDIGADATELFNALTGYSRQNNYRKLLVAPVGLRHGIIDRIEREIRFHKQYGDGCLIFKINALTDPDIIHHLYRASQAGIRIDLIIRGICCLRPGIAGISENIRVRSIVGRFLEHSRIYYFGNHGDEEIYLGSADMMQRNLNNRVETLFPIDLPVLRKAIREHLLGPLLADTVNAHTLYPDGTYQRISPPNEEPAFDCQSWFITHPLFEMEEEEETAATTINPLPSSA